MVTQQSIAGERKEITDDTVCYKSLYIMITVMVMIKIKIIPLKVVIYIIIRSKLLPTIFPKFIILE